MWSYLTGAAADQRGVEVAGAEEHDAQAALDEHERMTLAEERAKLNLVRQQLEAEENSWQWSKEPPSRVAQKTWLIHPDKDKRNADAEEVLKSTYDPTFKTAVFSQDSNLDPIRYDTKYLYPPRWYDSWTPNSLVGNRMHRLFGDSRIQNLDDKVECAQLLSKAEAHREERNSHRQRLRFGLYAAVYAVLFAIPVLVELVVPVTTAGCQALMKGGQPLEDDPCMLRPHSPVGFWFALLMLVIAKVSTVRVDWHWWSAKFPSEFQWWRDHLPACCQPDTSAPADEVDWWAEHFPVIFKPDDLQFLEREWAPLAPLIAVVVSVLCFVFGCVLAGVSVLLWAIAHLMRAALRLLRERGSPYYAMVQPCCEAAATIILYVGDLVLECVHLWGPFVAGLAFVFSHFEHFNQGLLEVGPDSSGYFGVKPKGESVDPDLRGSSTCMRLRPEEVVPFAYAYFGAAQVSLFMLGAVTLSLAELLKLKKEDRYILKGWVDIDGPLALNDVLAKSQALSSLRSWKDAAESRLGALEDAIPSPATKFIGKHFKKVVPANFLAEHAEQNSAVASKYLEEDLKKVFNAGLVELQGAFKPEELETQIGDLVLVLDLETVSWPGVVMVTGFVFWATLEGTVASPCLLSPGGQCTAIFRLFFGWTKICGTDEYVLGMQTIALLFVLAASAMLATERVAQAWSGMQAALRVVLSVSALAVAMLLLLIASGLANTLHDISASAMPWLPISSWWVRDTLVVVFLLEFAVLAILAVQRAEEELDKRFPRFRSFYKGSLSTLVIFLFLLFYTFTQGAFDFQGQGTVAQQSSGAKYFAAGLRTLVYRMLLTLWLLRFLAFCAGRARLLKLSPHEGERFVDRALLPEALGMIESVSVQATRATAAVPGTSRAAWGQEAAWLRQCTRHKVQSGLPAQWRRAQVVPSTEQHPEDGTQPYVGDEQHLLDSSAGQTYFDTDPRPDDGYPPDGPPAGGLQADPFLSRS